MANWMKWMGQIVLTVLCFYFIALESEVEARGGRGGGRGGFRGRYRSRYRSRVSSRSRSGWSSTRTAIVAGTLFGAAAYKRRRRFHSYPDSDPAICHNSQYVGNGTIFYYGKFICPMDNQPDDYAYCCGPEGSQRCCKFFDDAGRTAGVVIGVIIGAVVIGLVIFFCVCKQKMNKSPGQVISSFRNRKSKNTPVGYHAAPPAHTMTYPVQPATDGMQPPPPSYDAAAGNEKQNLPYGMNPEPGYNKQPLPNGDFSDSGPVPYPMNPGQPAPYGGPGQDTGFAAQPYPYPPDQGSGYPPQPYPPPPAGNAYQPYPPQ